MKSIVMGRPFKNRRGPKQPPYRCNGVRERRLGLCVPSRDPQTNSMSPGMGGKDQANHAEQPEKTRPRPQNRLGHTLSRCLEAQMSSPFLKGGLDRPTGGEVCDNLFRVQRSVRGIEVLVPVCSVQVVDEHPTDRHQSLAAFVPVGLSNDSIVSPGSGKDVSVLASGHLPRFASG